MAFKDRVRSVVVAAAFGGKCPSCGCKDFASSPFAGVRRCCACGCFVTKAGMVDIGYSDYVPIPMFDPRDVDSFVGGFVEVAA